MTPAMKLGPGAKLTNLDLQSYVLSFLNSISTTLSDFSCWSERVNGCNYIASFKKKPYTWITLNLPMYQPLGCSPKLLWGLWKWQRNEWRKQPSRSYLNFLDAVPQRILFWVKPVKSSSTWQPLLRCSKALATENKVRTVGGARSHVDSDHSSPTWTYINK